MLHGMADPIFSPMESVDYVERIARDAGSAQEAASFARLFLVPGVNHCRGGIGTEEFDALSPLVDWVEQGKAPDRILARSSPANRIHPDRSRPLCAWPSYPKYNGSGNVESAENFACATDR
jgi:feruloyl esterase